MRREGDHLLLGELIVDIQQIDVTPVTTGLGAPNLDRATYVILAMNLEHIQSESQLAVLAASDLLCSAAIAMSLAGPVKLVDELVAVVDLLYLWDMRLKAIEGVLSTHGHFELRLSRRRYLSWVIIRIKWMIPEGSKPAVPSRW